MKKHMMKFMGVSALVLATAFAPISLAQNALAAPNTGTVAASTVSTFSYVVQPGNSLSTLAKAYGTTVSAILALNPQITNPNLIYPGEVILFPVGSGITPIVPVTSSGASAFITPSSGPQGSYVQVFVSGFPADTPIQIGLHKLNRKLIEATADVNTDVNGNAIVTVRIPTGANANNNLVWLAQVTTTSGKSLTVSSNEFVISTSIPVYTGTFTYLVRSGDTLSILAREYGTSVSAILAFNPQITNPSKIYPGETLNIPTGQSITPIVPITSSVPYAQIAPSTGPQGTYVQVVVSGFPANTPIQIGLHKLNQKLIESTSNTTTDAYGNATVTMRIPVGSNVNNNLVWLAQVSTTSGKSLTVSSNEFVISTSTPVYTGAFTYLVRPGDTLSILAQEYGTSVSAILALNPQITNPSSIYPGETLVIPAGQVTVPMTSTQPSALITPSSGPQGTYIQVILGGFPANTSVEIGLHKYDRTLIESHTNATTNAIGQAYVTMRIPTGSNLNNNQEWLAQVTTNSGKSLTITSNPFYVTGY